MTLLDLIREQADKIARSEYGKSYQELIPIRQTEVWFDARIRAEEILNKEVRHER